MSVTVSFHGDGFDKKSSSSRLDSALYHATNQAAADMDQFVPFKSGYLSNTGHTFKPSLSSFFPTNYKGSLPVIHVQRLSL